MEQQPAQPASNRLDATDVVRLCFAAVFILILAYSGWTMLKLTLLAETPEEKTAKEIARAGPLKAKLLRMGADLKEAERKGDGRRADAMLADATTLMQRLNDQVDSRPDLRDCQLAAAHLARGVVAVGQGSVWGDEYRFEAAVKDCKA